MPRNPVLRKPIRLHLSLEETTLRKLRRLAKGKATSVTEIIRNLAESYAAGRLRPSIHEPLEAAINRIKALRRRSAPTPISSQRLLRELRDARA